MVASYYTNAPICSLDPWVLHGWESRGCNFSSRSFTSFSCSASSLTSSLFASFSTSSSIFRLEVIGIEQFTKRHNVHTIVQLYVVSIIILYTPLTVIVQGYNSQNIFHCGDSQDTLQHLYCLAHALTHSTLSVSSTTESTVKSASSRPALHVIWVELVSR